MDLDTTERLERYLKEAPVLHVRPLEGGGGHSNKATLILQGGVGVAAKRAADEQMKIQARREVAAWVLATELAMPHLVPATVLRQVPAGDDPSGDQVESSVQILWPRFKTALEGPTPASDCDDDTSWPIAVFDLLAANTDRNDGNWGTIEGLPRVALIDHGHAFAGTGSSSPFVARHMGTVLPANLREQVVRFHSGSGTSRLTEYLDAEACKGVFERAAKLAQEGTLT
ncbi:MAG: hypothetical protein ACHQCH_00635 [Solirubrobacterales bacterium]